MKTIGMIGGMSWESSIEYYRLVNEEVKRQLGGLHSAQCLMYSVDFEEIERYQHQGDWERATDVMIAAAQRLERGGADFVVICTNTMHKMADEVQAAINIPLLHIVDATAQAVKSKGIEKVGLLGTRFTMEGDFYGGRLKAHDLDVVIPDLPDREIVHRIIYQELVLGKIQTSSRDEFQRIIQTLQQNGTEGIVLGCTEIGLLIKQEDNILPVFDTTVVHALAAVDVALGNKNIEEFLPG
ncbi:MAG: aspartate racemase [Chloroflexi bacterium HGW-Chloroflexi-2]|jgi:aspartate racemase|nr:MAG: aspartate racemase [Chloroflexi bacterium HGW-Chloroflexi-2]